MTLAYVVPVGKVTMTVASLTAEWQLGGIIAKPLMQIAFRWNHLNV